MKSKRDKLDLFGFPCEYCAGRVLGRTVGRELIQVRKDDYVALEKVPIGVCDTCSAHYYGARVLHQAEELYRKGAQRQVGVPVARYVRME